jgi:hypothetical protein
VGTNSPSRKYINFSCSSKYSPPSQGKILEAVVEDEAINDTIYTLGRILKQAEF